MSEKPIKTRTFRLNKLVRDKIIALTLSYGGTTQSQKLSGSRLNQMLVEKLIEEAHELKESALSIEEVADLQEIIDQLCKNLEVSPEALQKIQKEKRDQKGGFKNGDFIETVTLPAEHTWAQYYASDPKRFPEVKSGPA